MVRWFETGVLALLVGGCASMSGLLEARFSREHSCQRDQVHVSERGGNIFVAEGCGQRAEYVCGSIVGRKGSERECAERGVLPNAETQPPKRTYFNLPEPPK